jgi:hypothetical protein
MKYTLIKILLLSVPMASVHNTYIYGTMDTVITFLLRCRQVIVLYNDVNKMYSPKGYNP